MSWGKLILENELYEQQERAAAAAANPWGPLVDLPVEEVVEVSVPAATDAPPPPPVEQMSVTSVERRLAEDPAFWSEALTLELLREAPRKQAMRAILRTMEAEKVDPEVIAQARAVVESPE
jgi:hypothetical protein